MVTVHRSSFISGYREHCDGQHQIGLRENRWIAIRIGHQALTEVNVHETCKACISKITFYLSAFCDRVLVFVAAFAQIK